MSLIGQIDQLGTIPGAVAGSLGQADAGGLGRAIGPSSNSCPSKALDHPLRAATVGLGQYDNEFLAAPANDNVLAAHMLAQRLRRPAQKRRRLPHDPSDR